MSEFTGKLRPTSSRGDRKFTPMLGSDKSQIPKRTESNKSKKCDEHDNVCAICLEEDLDPKNETTAICLDCNATPLLQGVVHCFHKICLAGYIRSLGIKPKNCPICKQSISDDNLQKLSELLPTAAQAAAVTQAPLGEDIRGNPRYRRATIPIPTGGFILPRLPPHVYSADPRTPGQMSIFSQVYGSALNVYAPLDGMYNNDVWELKYSAQHVEGEGFSVIGDKVFYKETPMKRDYIYVVAPNDPTLYDKIIASTVGVYNRMISAPTECMRSIMGGKRRATKRRRSTRRKGYKKRSTKRRGTRRRRR